MATMAITAEWGTLREGASYLEQITFVRDQLNYILAENLSPHPEYTRADRDGYELILASGSEGNAAKFFESKREAASKYGGKIKNMEVISWMKKRGIWEGG